MLQYQTIEPATPGQFPGQVPPEGDIWFRFVGGGGANKKRSLT